MAKAGRQQPAKPVSRNPSNVGELLTDTLAGGDRIPLCPPLTHRIREVTGRYQGEDVATVVHCEVCGRTWDQILVESPEDRAAFEGWLKDRGGAAE